MTVDVRWGKADMGETAARRSKPRASGRQHYRLAALNSALGGKWIGLLKEIAPHTVRVALLFNPATVAAPQSFMPSIQAAASSFAIQASAAPVHRSDEIEGVIAAQARNPGGSLIVMPDAFSVVNRELIIALTAKYGVPAIYYLRLFADSGGLISYGDDRDECPPGGREDDASSKARNLLTFRCKRRPSTNWSSTSRPQKRWASTYPCSFNSVPTQWSNEVAMSAIGTSGHRLVALHMSAFGGKADMPFCTAHVCF